MALKFHGLHAFMPSSIWKKRRCRKKKHQRSWGCPKALTDSPIWGHPKFTDTITLENIYDWNRDHLTKRLQNLETFRSLGETSQVIFETSSPLLAQRFFFLRWWVFLEAKLDLMEVSISMNFQSQSLFWKNFCVTQRGQVVFMGFGCLDFCVFGLMSNSVFEAGCQPADIWEWLRGSLWFGTFTLEHEKLRSLNLPPKIDRVKGFFEGQRWGNPLRRMSLMSFPFISLKSFLISGFIWPDVLDQTMLYIYIYTHRFVI